MGSNRWRQPHGFKMESRGGSGGFTTLWLHRARREKEGLARGSGTAGGGKKATADRTKSGGNTGGICASANKPPLSVSVCPTPHETLGG